MEQVRAGGFKLIGIKLSHKTSSEGDCRALWQRFMDEELKRRIPEKISDDIFAVYFEYEGDQEKAYSYFVGCKVKMDTRTPEGLDGIFIPSETYLKFIGKGNMRETIDHAWAQISNPAITRAWRYDYEVQHDSDSVDIYVSFNG